MKGQHTPLQAECKIATLSGMARSIIAQNLQKSYRVYEKKEGALASISSLWNRTYIQKHALKSFNLAVESGELVGLLGPNGAGKTTLMKALSGLVVPTAGTASVLGRTPHRRSPDFCKDITLVMGNKSQLWWDLPAYDSFRLLQKYYEIESDAFTQRVAQLSRELHTEQLLERHVRTLSLGERMKMELMACLLHNPKVIFLDEPTIGLDVASQGNIRAFLQRYHQEHECTILITSHYMADIEALCERVVFIAEGQKRFDGSIKDFSNLLGDSRTVSFTFSTPVENTAVFWSRLNASFNDDCSAVTIQAPREELAQLVPQIFSQYPVADFQSERMPIERVMKSLMENPEILANQSL